MRFVGMLKKQAAASFVTAHGVLGTPPRFMLPQCWLQIEGMWPYWLDGAGPRTVRNSLDLDSMVLLTGRAPPHSGRPQRPQTSSSSFSAAHTCSGCPLPGTKVSVDDADLCCLL